MLCKYSYGYVGIYIESDYETEGPRLEEQSRNRKENLVSETRIP